MDRIKEFLRKKGFYIALGTGVLAVIGLMVVYNYNYYKDEIGGVSVDLNAPADTQEEQQDTQLAQTNQADATGSIDATAGSTDAQTEPAEKVDSKDATSDTSTVNAEPQKNTESENSSDTIDTADSKEPVGETVPADTTNVIINEQGEIVANSYKEGDTLVWPVEGTVILPYSMDTTVYYKTLQCYRCNPGMLIQADEGSNVLSAYEGVVDSISEDKEHGTIVTVVMGNGYTAKYGQLMNVTVSEGDSITTAQNIGEVAPVSSYYAEEGNHVYFELQKDGTPINPILYMQ